MENFRQVLKENQNVLVDFYADWCGPCRMLAPVIEEIKVETADFLKVIKVNVDENPDIASQYGVRSIPTLVYLKEGVVAGQSVGFRSKKEILKMLQ